MSSKGIAAIKEAIAEKKIDDFEDNTVLRWKLNGKFAYTAIKISAKGEWYTSSKYDGIIPARMDFATLMDVLARPEVSEIEVATSWSAVD